MSDERLTHDKLPHPANKPVPFPDVNTWDEANDYVLGAFHACVDKIGKTEGAEEDLWESAAQAYVGAYMGLIGLKALPAEQGMPKFKELVADANHKADKAAGGGEAKLTHDKLPRPKNKPVAFPKVDTWDEANDYVLAAFHACVDKAGKTTGADQRLWESAAQAYVGAYMGLVGLKALPADQGMPKFRELVADANHKADQASAAEKNA